MQQMLINNILIMFMKRDKLCWMSTVIALDIEILVSIQNM